MFCQGVHRARGLKKREATTSGDVGALFRFAKSRIFDNNVMGVIDKYFRTGLRHLYKQ